MTVKRACTSITRLACVACGNISTIWRIAGRMRPHGHRKQFYCSRCMERTLHRELEREHELASNDH